MPLSPRLLFPALLLVTACGPFSVEKINHRSDKPHASGPDDEVGGKPAPETKTPEGEAAARPAASKEPKTPQKKTVYDETFDRTAKLFFYQADPELADLFAPNGTSQLCWPTALAFTLESLRTDHEPPLSRLEKPTVRALFSTCGTDRKVGTTMPQGVTCADAKISSAGYQPNLKVTGLDAKWKAFGLYPEATITEEGVVSPTLLRKELSAGSSVILFIGYYRLDPEKNIWTRSRGHFVTVTGFAYKTDWVDEVVDLHVVNPAHDYEGETGDGELPGDVVRMTRISSGTPPLPKEVAFELRGPHFELGENALAAVESVLEIRAK